MTSRTAEAASSAPSFDTIEIVAMIVLLSISRHRRPRTLSVQSSKECFRLIGIVRPAPQLQVLNVRLAAGGKRHHVMELEPSSLGTPSFGTDERAASLVARPDSALDGCWDVSSS